MNGHDDDPKRRRDERPDDEAAPASKKANNENQELLQKLEALQAQVQQQNETLEKQKRIHKNRSLESLMNVSAGSIKITRVGRFYPHVNGNHPPAEAKEKDFPLRDPSPEKLKMETAVVSHLLLATVEQAFVDSPQLKFKENLSYGSEAGICHFVRHALIDAINIVELEGDQFEKGELTTKLERSLFGCRPDIMVVRDRQGVGLLAVEVKQPVEKGTTLTGYPKVLGHAFDHAQAMNAFGQGTRFVMLTTFEESNLCSLSELDFDEADCGEETGNCKPQDIAQTQSPPIFKEPPTKPHGESQQILSAVSRDSSVPSTSGSSSSPSSSPPRLPSMPETQSKTAFESEFIQDHGERLLYRSKSYKTHELVKLAYTALKLAKKKYKESSRSIYKLNPDQPFFFRRALRVVKGEVDGEKSRNAEHWWGDLHVELGQQIRSQKERSRVSQRNAKQTPIDGNDTEAFYIIGSLGYGATANVYHALDSSGKEVALKIYVNNYRGNEIMAEEEFDKESKKATETEMENLVRFYPFLEREVDVVRIFGLRCVVMPVFAPVDSKDRKNRLDEIKAVLEGTFKQQKLMYEDDDVRWRHVGLYKDSAGQEHCILYDLSDLVDASNDTEFASRHRAIFEERLPPEPEPEHQEQPLNTGTSGDTV